MSEQASSLRDLRPAAYNPRTITPLQREAMRKSYAKYGDLSGIVFNRRTKQLIGGHQRVELFRSAKNAKVVKQPHRDEKGTIAVGHVVIPDGKSSIRIPYREVAWDGDTEKAANIAANAAGGTFDHVKLGRVLVGLDKRKFDIESIPLDSVELRRAMRMFDYMNRKGGLGGGDDDGGGEFKIIDPDEIEASLEHCCPKCGYSWSGKSTAPKKLPSGKDFVRKGDGENIIKSMASDGKKGRQVAAKRDAARKRNVRTLVSEARRNDKKPAGAAAKRVTGKKLASGKRK